MSSRRRPLVSINGILDTRRASHRITQNSTRIDNKSVRERKYEPSDRKGPGQIDPQYVPEAPEAGDSKQEALVVDARILDISEDNKQGLQQLYTVYLEDDLPSKELGEDSGEVQDNDANTRSSTPKPVQEPDVPVDGDDLPVPTTTDRPVVRQSPAGKASKRKGSQSKDKVPRKRRSTKKEI